MVKRGAKKVVRRRVRRKLFLKWMLIGLLMIAPSLFWGNSVKGFIWYDVFTALALIGVVIAVYNFIKLLTTRRVVFD